MWRQGRSSCKLFDPDQDFYKLRDACYRENKLFEDTTFSVADMSQWRFLRPHVCNVNILLPLNFLKVRIDKNHIQIFNLGDHKQASTIR